MRLYRASRTANGQTTAFLYDGSNVLQDIQGGDVTRVYVTPGLDQYVSMTITGGDDAGTYFYNQDERSSVRNLTDDAGAVVNTYDYTAFGEMYGPSTDETVSQRYQYTGRELNSVSGNHFFRYRTYSSGIGAFTSRDPLGYVDGTSLYAGYFGMGIVTDEEGTVATWIVYLATQQLLGQMYGELSDDLSNGIQGYLAKAGSRQAIGACCAMRDNPNTVSWADGSWSTDVTGKFADCGGVRGKLKRYEKILNEPKTINPHAKKNGIARNPKLSLNAEYTKVAAWKWCKSAENAMGVWGMRVTISPVLEGVTKAGQKKKVNGPPKEIEEWDKANSVLITAKYNICCESIDALNAL